MTLGRNTTQGDVDYAVDSLVGIIDNLRMMSPLWEDFQFVTKKEIFNGYELF